MGNVAREQNRHEDAIAYFRMALTCAPRYAPVHNNLGLELAAKGDFEKAIECYRKAIEFDPDYVLASPCREKPEKPGGGATYTIVPFMLPDMVTVASGVADLNDQGHAVGWAELANGDVIGLHLNMATGFYTTLLGGTGVNAVNNLNQMVGPLGDVGAFWAGPSAVPVPLPPLLPTAPAPQMRSLGVQSGATDVNDDGIVIGASTELFELDNEDGTKSQITLTTGVVWRVVVDVNGNTSVDGPLPLPPLDGHTESFAGTGCLNELMAGAAQVTGYSSSPREAVVWTITLAPDGSLALPGLPSSLGTLGLNQPSWSASGGINNLAEVCGRSDKRPFFAPAGQQVQPLPVPRNTLDGSGNDINDDGDIVGFLELPFKGSNTLDGVHYAYMWKASELVDLSKQIPRHSGWDRLTWATVINNTGTIGGWGRFDVPKRGFLLVPNQP